MKRQLCLATLVLAFASFGTHCSAINILAPGDFIIPIDSDPWTDGFDPTYPETESPAQAIDDTLGTKYLNRAGHGAGFIVSPATTSTTVRSFRITTANDAASRTPSYFHLFGTNDATISSADTSTGESENWVLIDSFALDGDYNLPTAFNTPGPIVPIDNDTSYRHYKMEFPSLKGQFGWLMQIDEVEFFEDTAGTSTDILTGATDIRAIVNRRSGSATPAGENPNQLLDSASGTKYLNFGKENTGVIVTPASGPQVVTNFRIQTANDAPARDPASYVIYGTNDPIQSIGHTQGTDESWTQLDAGDLSLGDARGAYSDTIDINNNTAYASYKIVFPTLKDSANANSMQIAGLTLNTTDPAVLKINRQTGEVAIETSTALSFGSYEITSETFGVLAADNWTSIASTGADTNDTWAETAAEPGMLAESLIEGGTGDGLEITPGTPLSLGTILPIIPTAFEDLTFNLYAADGTTIISQRVDYDGAEVPIGDYSGNGSVDIEDFEMFMEVYGSQFERGVDSEVTRYLGGDLDGDFDSDITDYNLFVEFAGGAGALFGAQVPEPSTVVLLSLGAVAGILVRRARRGAVAALLAVFAIAGAANVTEAQTFSIVAPNQPVTITEPEGQAAESDQTAALALFDDTALDLLNINNELFNTNYDEITQDLYDFRSLIDQADPLSAPVYVFLDYGSSITTDWFVYAQRSGANYGADRVGKFDFWFSDTPFGETNSEIPAGEPEATVHISPTDNRLVTSTLYPYTLGGEHSGQYVAIGMTLSELSATVSAVNRPGGHEFRFLDGPTDLVLEVDRATGELTLMNNLSGAIPIDMTSYEINSPSGALDVEGFDGLGDEAGFSNWSIGGGSNENRLIDGDFVNFNTNSTISVGETGLSLGTGLNELFSVEDLTFTWTDADGRYFDARVVYTGEFPDILLGDFNDDGMVDLADYTVWRNNLGSTAGLPNDPTPAIVDASDYAIWKDNFGASAPPAAAGISAVPEPSAIWMGLAAVAAACCMGRSQRKS